MTRFRKGTIFLGRYVLLGPIGRGGVSIVYEAEDTLNARRVAIKLLEPEYAGDARARDRVLHPATVMTQLRDPGVPRLYEFGDAPLGDGSSIAYAVMDLLTGESLDSRLARGPLPVPDAVSVAATVADLLTLAHNQGIVLGAFGPASVLLTPDGAKVVDFDAAGPTLAVAAADDILALGALMFEMVTGAPPTATGLLAAEAVLPFALVDLCRRCLSQPAHRPDAATVAFELWALLTPGPSYPPSTAARAAAEPTQLETRASVLARVARQEATVQAAQARGALARAALDRSARAQADRTRGAASPAGPTGPTGAAKHAAAKHAAAERAAARHAAAAEQAARHAAAVTAAQAAADHAADLAAEQAAAVAARAAAQRAEREAAEQAAAELAEWELAAQELAGRERVARERARAERERAEWIGVLRDAPDDRHRGEVPQPVPVGYVGQGGRHRRRRPAWSGPTTSHLPVG